MTFHFDLSANLYQETFQIGHGWNNPTTITRKASVENQFGASGIMELTDLFFQTVKEYTGQSIIHSNEIVITNSQTFVLVKIKNLISKMGWNENQNGENYVRHLNITINPKLDQKDIPCSEAILIEKMGISQLDTIHEWTLTLEGLNQIQTFIFRTTEKETTEHLTDNLLKP